MTIQNSSTTLIKSLSAMSQTGSSEASNRQTMQKAQQLVRESDLDADTIKTVCAAIAKAANPSGWFYDNNGVDAGLEILESMAQPKQKDEKKVSLFCKAHLLTKKIIKSGDSYRVTFAACLKQAWRSEAPQGRQESLQR